jgi:hypothetical protein
MQRALLYPCSQWLRSTALEPPPLAPVLAVARAAVPALVLRAPVLAAQTAVARAAVLALVLLAPVLAVARAEVLAHVLPAPVLAVVSAAVLALVLLAPVLAVPCHGPWGLFRSLPALPTAIPAVILGAASTAAPVCVLAGATFVLARKGVSLLRLLRGWLLKLLNERQLLAMSSNLLWNNSCVSLLTCSGSFCSRKA